MSVTMTRFTVHPRVAAPEYRNEGYDVSSVYERPSRAKLRAWAYVKGLCDSANGTGLAVRSHNTFTFTANFYFFNPENGREMLAVITRDYNHAYYTD